MPIDLTPVLQAVIGLCVALITRRVIPWMRERFGRERTARLLTLASIAVRAAEQMYGKGKGQEKLAYALSVLKEQGFNVGFSEITAEEIRNAIEAAVYDMNAEAGANAAIDGGWD